RPGVRGPRTPTVLPDAAAAAGGCRGPPGDRSRLHPARRAARVLGPVRPERRVKRSTGRLGLAGPAPVRSPRGPGSARPPAAWRTVPLAPVPGDAGTPAPGRWGSGRPNQVEQAIAELARRRHPIPPQRALRDVAQLAEGSLGESLAPDVAAL